MASAGHQVAHASARRRSTVRGAALVEVLVAFVVLSVAGLAAARLQSPMFRGADAARQEADAARLAQADIEHWRSVAGPSGYDTLASGTTVSVATAGGANTDDRLTRTVVDAPGPMLRHKAVAEQVEWLDRSGRTQQVVLETIVARADPMFAGALWLSRTAPPLLPRDGHAPSVTGTAHALGDGTSLIELAGAGTPVLRVDDRSGAVLATCPTEAWTFATASPSSLAGCVSSRGRLLAGHVQFDITAAASPTTFGMRLALTAGGDPSSPPVCATTADATGAGSSYRCVVYTAASDGAWSGRSTVVPIGWTIGTAADQRKVCRAVHDDDGSGAIDHNAEHPAEYTAVSEPLAHQNFLIVRGDVACPAGATDDAGLRTVQQQP